jgi:uncharacterized protein (TIGR02231 family)
MRFNLATPIATVTRGALLTVTALLLASASAHAADVAATSQIDAVTVFPSGAEVTRVLKIRVPAGEHIIVLKDLPAGAVPPSIRVEGKSTGALAIGAVDTQRTFLTEAETALSAAERRQIETDIEKLNDEKTGHAAAVEAAQAQKKLIGNLADLPGKPVPVGATAPAQPDWAQLAQLIAQQTAAAQRTILDAQVKMREADRKIVELQKKLAPIAPAQVERTEVKIAVTAQGATDADFTVRYQVANAAWTPFYDARLTTGTKTTTPKLQLVRRASIQQRTGEAWTNIALTLSTTRPTQGTQAPDLQSQLLDLFDPTTARTMSAPAPAAVAPPAAPAKQALGVGPQEDATRFGFRGDAKREPVAAQEVRATIDGNAFQALYGIPGRHSVATSGEVKRVQIDQSDVDATLTVRTVPKRDPKAFLYTKLTTPKTTAILAGQVALFRDGTFVGDGRFPQLAPGEEHELGFGQDDNVRVKYAVTDEKRGETGIISTSRTEAKNFKITVKSLHERPIQVRVIDQFPVTQNQEIKVETNSKIPPSGKDPDDKRGVIYWDATLAPDEERAFDFGYRITWPAAKQISGR